MDLRPIEKLDVDLVVVGAGAAGVAAAVTAARGGLRVAVAERYGFSGGGAVAGLSGTICGLYAASERPAPEQLVFGFADEFANRLDARGGLTAPVRYGKTFTRVHDPMVWRSVADELLVGSGVTVLYHAVVTGVLCEGGERINGVQVWTKQGPVEIRAAAVIDASGDADLIAMAGLPFTVGDRGRVQNPTMIFRIQGVDTGLFLAEYGADTIMPPRVSQAIDAFNEQADRPLPRRKIWLFITPRPDQLLCNMTRILGSDGRELNTLHHRDFTAAEIAGRAQVNDCVAFLRQHVVGCENATLNDTGVQVGVRQTRQIDGVARLGNDDVLGARKSAVGIVRAPWPIELHSGATPQVNWLLDDYYEVPYGCLVPSRGEGVIAAGRCLAAEHEAMASARVTAQCFGYGHAAGHAALLSLRENIPFRTISGSDVRALLNADGAKLD